MPLRQAKPKEMKGVCGIEVKGCPACADPASLSKETPGRVADEEKTERLPDGEVIARDVSKAGILLVHKGVHKTRSLGKSNSLSVPDSRGKGGQACRQ